MFTWITYIRIDNMLDMNDVYVFLNVIGVQFDLSYVDQF